MMWANNVLVTVSCLAWCHVAAAVPRTPSFDPVVVQVESQRRSYQEPQVMSHNISIHGENLLLDGQPYHILSGSLHYFRLPAEYWRDRLRKLKAAGLNTVSTYVEWSFHEPEYRQYSFEGDRDVAAFVRVAAEEGLRVLLRPGPYICAERDLGGFPYWLLGRYPEIRLRTRDKDFMEESKIWLAKLFEQLKPLLFGNGGPIIFVQVENEYGSFGGDLEYKVQMRDIYLQHVGTAAVLYTTDGGARDYYSRGYVPGALTTIDFGPGAKVKRAFEDLRQFMSEGPLMNSEYYPGWLTHWGESLQTRSTEAVIRTMREMLEQKIHINIYVFYGGTNFGFTSGANYNNKYEPVITSYDYDAPLSEAGDLTPKYHALRDLLKEFNYVPKDEPVPTSSPKGAYGPVAVTARLGLLSAAGRAALGKKYPDVSGPTLPSFEQLLQKSGFVLYETTLQTKGDKSIYIQRPRDWIHVYVDGQYKGSLNRMFKRFTLRIESKENSKLSLLVEDQGRINFGNRIVDRKGILSAVTYDNKTLDGKWEITGYPLEVVDKADGHVAGKPNFSTGPVFFRGSITLPEGQKPLDTYLDTTGWGKGCVWVNGHNIGRYWPGLGPQVTLYVPGVWLKPAPASNVVEILELESAPDEYSMMFIDYPILNRTTYMSYS